MKTTFNLANILDRTCPIRTLEMAFQSKISKFSGRTWHHTLLTAHSFGTQVICRSSKNILIFHTHWKGWTVCVAFFQTCNPFWPAMRLLLLIACARGATTELTSPSGVSACDACRLASCRVALEWNLAA